MLAEFWWPSAPLVSRGGAAKKLIEFSLRALRIFTIYMKGK
jgi:hypothetical protein